jgi:hypothetical protein
MRLCPITDYPGLGDFEMFEHLSESRPVAAFLLGSSVEPLENYFAASMVELLQHLCVAAYSVIVEVALKLLTELDHEGHGAQAAPVLLDPARQRGQCQGRQRGDKGYFRL